MSEITIYLVMAGYDYEGSSPVKAFKGKSAANDFAEHCADYQAKKPEWPPESAPEKEMDDFYEVDDLWQKNHPAHPEYNASRYYARPIGFASDNKEGE